MFLAIFERGTKKILKLPLDVSEFLKLYREGIIQMVSTVYVTKVRKTYYMRIARRNGRRKKLVENGMRIAQKS